MKNGDDRDNIRVRSHEIAVERRNGVIEALVLECGCHVRYRGDESVMYYEPGSKHKPPKRYATDNLLMDPMGLDIDIRIPKIGSLGLWGQVDIRGKKHIQKMPVYKHARTKAPSNGLPKVEEVKEFFINQWLITSIYRSESFKKPCFIQLAPLSELIKAGYGEGEKDGYYLFSEG